MSVSPPGLSVGCVMMAKRINKKLTQDRFRGRLPTGQRPTQVAPLQTDEDSQLLVRN